MIYKMTAILFLRKCLLRWERNYFAWEYEHNNKIIKNRKFEIKIWLLYTLIRLLQT